MRKKKEPKPVLCVRKLAVGRTCENCRNFRVCKLIPMMNDITRTGMISACRTWFSPLNPGYISGEDIVYVDAQDLFLVLANSCKEWKAWGDPA